MKKLEQYLLERNLTNAAFGAVVGFAESTVRHWRKGKRKPSLVALQKIATATNGEITPNDWLIN